MKLLLGEVFDQVKKLKKPEDKIAFLRQQAGPAPGNRALFYVLWLSYSDTITWLLPEGIPPFVPWEEARGNRNRAGSEPTELLRELRRMYLFLKGTGDHVPKLTREKRFQELLTVLPKADRDFFIAMKDKKVAEEYKLSRKLLDAAFPGLMEAPFTNRFVAR